MDRSVALKVPMTGRPKKDPVLYQPYDPCWLGTDLPVYAGQVVARARKAYRPALSQRGLASKVGLSKTAIQHLEDGVRWVQQKYLLHICQVLGLHPWDLYPPRQPDLVDALVTHLRPETPRTRELTHICLAVVTQRDTWLSPTEYARCTSP